MTVTNVYLMLAESKLRILTVQEWLVNISINKSVSQSVILLCNLTNDVMYWLAFYFVVGNSQVRI
jgi:hypothetical protein